MDLVQFGTRMQYRRRALGLTQADISIKVKRTKSYISSLERSTPHPSTGMPRHPNRELVELLAVALDDNVDELLLLAGHSPTTGTVAARIRKTVERIPSMSPAAARLIQEVRHLLERMEPLVERMETALAGAGPAFTSSSPTPAVPSDTTSDAPVEPPNTEPDMDAVVSPDTQEAGAPSRLDPPVGDRPSLPGHPQWQCFEVDFGPIDVPSGVDYGVRPHDLDKILLPLPRHVASRLRQITALSQMRGHYMHRVTLASLLLFAIYQLDPRLLLPYPAAPVDTPAPAERPPLPAPGRWRTYTLDIGTIDLPVGLDFRINRIGFDKMAIQLPQSLMTRLRSISAAHSYRGDRTTITDVIVYALYRLDARLVTPPAS